MKIGITLHPYGDLQPSGLGEYIFSLSKTLAQECTEHTLVFFVKGSHKLPPEFIKHTHHEVRFVDAKYIWLDKAYMKNKDIDIWIYHNPMLPFFFVPKKSVVIALDFSFMHLMRGSFRRLLKLNLYRFLNLNALVKATKVATISNYTSRELHRWFPMITKEKVSPIYAGYRDLSTVPAESISLPENFYLSVGVIKPRKNQLKVVEAFLLAKARGLKGSLVVAGKGQNVYEDRIRSAIKDSPYADDVILPGYLSDGQLVSAYTSATCLVFPSRIEGFGFPVLEAMSLGVPVITSNTSSLDEVAGEAALKVDPENVEEIATAMLRMGDEAVRDMYRTKGYAQCNNFSWKKTAERLLAEVNKL